MDKSYGFSHTFRVGKMFDLRGLKEKTGKPDRRISAIYPMKYRTIQTAPIIVIKFTIPFYP